MTWQHVATHIVENRPEYRMELEEFRSGSGDQMLFAHIKVHKPTASTLKHMREHWRLFRTCVTAPLYAVGAVDDDKWERFVSKFGFKFLQHVVCENGERRRLFLNQEEKEHGRPVFPGPIQNRQSEQSG